MAPYTFEGGKALHLTVGIGSGAFRTDVITPKDRDGHPLSGLLNPVQTAATETAPMVAAVVDNVNLCSWRALPWALAEVFAWLLPLIQHLGARLECAAHL
jgi:hypothetical protein